MIDAAVSKLAAYALRTGLIEESESLWAVNTILDALKLDSYTDPGQEWGEIELAPVLEELLDDAYARGDSTNAAVSSMSACVQSVEQLLATRYDSATRLLPL